MKQLRGDSGNPASLGNVRIISIEGGSSLQLGETLNKMLQEMGKDSKLVRPSFEEPNAPPMPKVDPKQSMPPQPKKISSGDTIDANFYLVSQQPQLVDPQKPDTQKPKVSGPPVTITPVGSKIIVTSDDPQTQQLVRELVSMLTAAPGEHDFRVIRLKNGNSVEAAKFIDSWFNGTPVTGPQQNTPQQSGGFPFFGGGGGGGNRGGGGFGGGQGAADLAEVKAIPSVASMLMRQ